MEENNILKTKLKYIKEISIITLVLLCLIFFITSNENHNKVSDLTQELSSLKEQNNNLISQNETFEGDITNLNQKIKDYETSISKYTNTINELEAKATTQRNLYSTLQTDYDVLLNKYNKLQEQSVERQEQTYLISASSNETIEEEVEVETSSYGVYITKTGEKYHEETCNYLKKSKIPISESEAISRGYEPCSQCTP